MISTSEVKVSCVVDATDCDRAINALCQVFEVSADAIKPVSMQQAARITDPESTTQPVRAVALDINQARLAIRQVPDRPGMAAQLFGLLAQQNISVDTIIQSQRCRIINGIQTRDIAFTVAQIDASAARNTLEQAALECGEIIVDSAIAKVSIVGTNMIGQPGVAALMFEALAQHQINIQMIATSEIKISCVVAQDQGVAALKAIHSAFGLAGKDKIKVPA